MTLGFTVMFPVVFASNIMVRPETMPPWLQAFVDRNPVTHMTTAMRELFAGVVDPATLALALLAPVLMTAALAPLVLVLYRRH
jgi:ABC-2 type transport system permease protein